MFNQIKQLLQDSNGKLSSIRVSSFLVLFSVLGVFIEKNIVNHGFIDFPPGSVEIILVVIGGKILHSVFGEKNGKPPEDETSKDTNQ